MLKETHTISYIQQASDKWIEGDEEETAHAQAIESLEVVTITLALGLWPKQRLTRVKAKRETRESHLVPLLHIVPFCEGPNEKPERFAK